MSEIKAYKELSEYLSNDGKRVATVVKEIGTKRFIVRMKNDSGSYFTASCNGEEEAEAIAEEWVQS